MTETEFRGWCEVVLEENKDLESLWVRANEIAKYDPILGELERAGVVAMERTIHYVRGKLGKK